VIQMIDRVIPRYFGSQTMSYRRLSTFKNDDALNFTAAWSD